MVGQGLEPHLKSGGKGELDVGRTYLVAGGIVALLKVTYLLSGETDPSCTFYCDCL